MFALAALSRSWSWRTSIWMALAAGVLNVLSFAPFHLWPLQILSLALVFLLAWQHPDWSIWRMALLGGAYAFGWLGSGVSWLLIAMTRYGNLPLWLALLALVLFSAYLASYAAAALALAHTLRRRWKLSPTTFLLLVFPALWVISEWLRGWLLTGFPWLVSGYAHGDSPLAGYAAVLGVYGLSWINAGLAAALVLALVQRTLWFRMLGGLLLVMLLGTGLRQMAWTTALGQAMNVRLLQGNVEQGIKFDIAHINDSLALYHQMISAAPADLVAAPETALPLLSSQLPPDYLPRLNDFTQRTHSTLIVGVGVHDGGNSYSNSVLGFGAEYAQQAYRYDKHHLVPLGEFIPFGFRWFVEMMQIPLGDFSSAGLHQRPMLVKDQLVLPNICYEDLFGEEIAQQLATQLSSQGKTASILLNVSNLAWYGDSLAIPQHLQISQMRSLETGRPMLRATNNGATAVIDAHGQVLAQLKPLSRGTLAATVQGTSGLTPYVRFGNVSVIVLALLSLLFAFGIAKKPRGLE